MAIYFKTNNPQDLLVEFKSAIKKGHVSTWLCDEDGDFTHTPDQWKNRAWLRPKIEANKLALYIFGPKHVNISSEVYAIYHGRFIESMLRHCDQLFIDAISTALPRGSDSVSHE